MKRLATLKHPGFPLVVMAVVVLSAGCAGGTAAPGPGEIVLEDMRFTPNQINAKVGVPLTLRLSNRGTERHDLNFGSFHMPGLQGVEAILNPGETRTITLTFDQPGTHTFICTLPGHAAAGRAFAPR